jgi:N-acetylmuramoyl-L-alanine amidase
MKIWAAFRLAAFAGAVLAGSAMAAAAAGDAAGGTAPVPATDGAGAAAAPMPATSAAMPYVLDARVVGDDSRVRFVVDTSAPLDAAVFALADPYRIVIDLPEVHFVLPDGAGSEGRALISAFRYGVISAGKSRIVIDVTGPVAIDKQFVVPPADGQPARLVVDLVPTTRDKFLAAVQSYRQSHAAAPDTSAAAAETSGDNGKPLVVLDPGHGGIDSGTRGSDGVLEKDVVLAFAKVLGDKLTATNRYRVAFTRTDDTYVSLGDRVKMARDQHAALFLSVHVNSFPTGVVRGTIVYTVSDAASDKMAAALADSENQSDALAGIDVKAEDSDQVKDILLDLTQRETRNFGVAFAQALVRHLGRTTMMFKVPHQQASFKVLEAPDVPSALIELGYISNHEDEKELTSPDWQAKVADSMVAAIDGYFQKETAATFASGAEP